MGFRVAIPARYASTRLPGKPLLDIAGKPMLQHVYERAVESGAESVVIATDDPRIRDAAEGFGAPVCMTSPRHRSGSERLAEAAEKLGYGDGEILVNLQGDEPLMPPALIRQVAEDLEGHGGADVTTLCTPIRSSEEVFDTNVVKVVRDEAGFALYFSRAPIPWERDAFAPEGGWRDRRGGGAPDAAPGNHYRHLGLYAYRVGYLRAYVGQAPCELERLEALEQLRVLWHGGRIRVAEAEELPAPGVDTEADLERVRALLSGR